MGELQFRKHPRHSPIMRWGIPGVSTFRTSQWKNHTHFLKCWLQCTRLSGREKCSLGTAIHFSQLLLLKSDAVRIKNGIEESTVGLRTCLCTSTPWSLTSVWLAVAEPSFITVPPVPCASRCQSKIKRNHSKYSIFALTVNMKRHQGCKETWIKAPSLPFCLWVMRWLKVF